MQCQVLTSGSAQARIAILKLCFRNNEVCVNSCDPKLKGPGMSLFCSFPVAFTLVDSVLIVKFL